MQALHRSYYEKRQGQKKAGSVIPRCQVSVHRMASKSVRFALVQKHDSGEIAL
jgi:hypothetical protein